jgi:Zn-dependent M28 family amino/carboxypeptidase
MAGAALDSWPDSPGINANGSGAAVLLEIAENLSRTRLDHTVRFAWWGGNTAGLLGSGTYVTGLSASELDAIALYLDVNVVGSPNYAMFVIDGDGSALPAIFPVAASATIEGFFADFLAGGGHATEPTEAGGLSDYRGFASSGIPYSGLFTGASGIKTAQQAATYGGTAGVAYDPCYQQACDTYANASIDALDQVSDAVAAAILHFGTAAGLPVRGGSTNSAHSGPAIAAASE